MAAPIVAGIAADVLSAHPAWTPDEVKGALTYRSAGQTGIFVRPATAIGRLPADKALDASNQELVANQRLAPRVFIDPRTGTIDQARASWGQVTWTPATDPLRASWGAASWACDCSRMTVNAVDPTRASWGRASWGNASWASFFGQTPAQHGELAGGSKRARAERLDELRWPNAAAGASPPFHGQCLTDEPGGCISPKLVDETGAPAVSSAASDVPRLRCPSPLAEKPDRRLANRDTRVKTTRDRHSKAAEFPTAVERLASPGGENTPSHAS